MTSPAPIFGLPHGLVCGICLPYTTKFLLPNPTYTTMAKRMGFAGTEEELGRQLVEHLAAFNRELDLPASFQEAGMDEARFLRKLDDFAAMAADSISTRLSPRVPDLEQIRRIYLDAYYGNPLD